MTTSKSTGVISRKLAPPPNPERLIERARLDAQLIGLVGGHRVVVVAATPGAGKTTSVAVACSALDRPRAWLAVDRTDQAPGRLVTYLEAAIARVLPDIDGVATRALAGGVSHPEATGLLVEAVGATPLVMVLDDLERLGDSEQAWAVIEAFIRYAPPTMTTVLLSRRDIPVALCELPLTPATVAVGEDELAFTALEAGEALSRDDGTTPTEPEIEAILQATGGWVAGVLFGAEPQTSAPTSDSGLATYLSARVLTELAPADREFLVRTAVLEEVDVESATALGIKVAGERLCALRSMHLPVSWRSDRLCVRCHALFREHLLELLRRSNPEQLRVLQLAKGQLLMNQGQDEEAVEVLLRCGAAAEALPAAQRSIARVTERLDFEVVERWLSQLAPVAPVRADQLHLAELLIAVGRGEFARGAALGDRLQMAGERDRFVTGSDQAAGLLAYCYGEVGRLAESRAIVELAGEGPSTNVLRYTERLSSEATDQSRPAPTGGPLDALLLAVDYGLGRFEHITVPAASRWTMANHTPHRIAALRAAGRTEEALSLYADAERSGVMEGGFKGFVATDLLVDAGRREDALAALAEGRAFLERSGSRYRWLLSFLAEARLALRLDRDHESALETLAMVRRQLEDFPVTFIREACGTWAGFALLLADRVDEAVSELRLVVSTMVAGDRLLDLPTAAVYLAEAEWRAGEEERSDRAADLAFAAARRQGSNHLLLQALADFPAVISRRIDAEIGSDSAWHELGRTLVARGSQLEVPVGSALELHDLGRPTLRVDGELRHPRIAKTYELLAYLARQDGNAATRAELLDALFDGREDESTRAYLRQAINQLTRLMAEPEAVVSGGGVVSLSARVRLTTTSGRFESRLAEARGRHGAERLEITLEALSIVEAGEYLEGADHAWVEERRRQLAAAAGDARAEAGRLAFEQGRHLEALALNERTLEEDPVREDCWRLQMELKGALGDDAGVLTAFRACSEALAVLGASPAPSTRSLLERLRR